MARRDRRQQWIAADLLVLARDVVAGAERATRAGKHQNTHGIVHLRLQNGFAEIAFDGLGQAVQPLGGVELNPRDARLPELNLEGDRVRLQPANSQMDPIYCSAADVEVKGKVVSVIRKF